MEIPKRLFHYTVGLKLPQIQADGYLKTTPTKPRLGERPLVWLSCNPDYEQTARKHFMEPGQSESRLGSLSEMTNYCNGVYRFCFETKDFPEYLKPLHWSILKHRSRMKKKLIDRLVKRARGVGAHPRDWYGVIGRLPIDFATLESLDPETGSWRPSLLSKAASETPRYNVEQVLDHQVPPNLRSRDEHWQE